MTDRHRLELGELLRRLPELGADDVGRLLDLAGQGFAELDGVAILLSDYQERTLIEIGPDGTAVGQATPIAGSLAGRAFTSQQPAASADGLTLWMPLTNRWRRFGVLRMTATEPFPEQTRDQGLSLAALLATVLDSASRWTDTFHRAKRREPLTLTAEMQWELLPPPSIAGIGVTMAGQLEPAYEVGGDTFDYAINAGLAHVAIFDPVGHDLRAALLAALAVGTYRNCRRSGIGLVETSERIDAALRSEFARETFVTGQLFELDLRTGRLRWTNAGHPLPLVLRDGHAHPLTLAPDRPWGLGPVDRTGTEASLQPGDRLLMITDGVVEARTADGDAFGQQRLIDLLTRDAGSVATPAEVLRRLLDAVLTHQGGSLDDDATAVLLEWRGPDSAPSLGG